MFGHCKDEFIKKVKQNKKCHPLLRRRGTEGEVMQIGRFIAGKK
jgi:hypothetical protein